ncbi:DinB family protein [Nocardia sp. NPDC004860]|uniref:DinB family protein n=1 Tax=Nocardia sp. NPDC004860 TaxID=3154557 RepID=UPI0033B9189A
MTHPNADREALTADLERARQDFHRLLAGTREDEWGKRSDGTRWTNEELLFHMVFGYMIVQKLVFLMRVFGRLPTWVGRKYAQALNTATGPFDVINFYGSRVAARVYNRNRMGAKLDRVIASLQRTLQRENAADLARGMHYPDRWDPYFRDYLTLSDVYRYPGRHYDHHRKQLTIASARQS